MMQYVCEIFHPVITSELDLLTFTKYEMAKTDTNSNQNFGPPTYIIIDVQSVEVS